MQILVPVNGQLGRLRVQVKQRGARLGRANLHFRKKSIAFQVHGDSQHPRAVLCE